MKLKCDTRSDHLNIIVKEYLWDFGHSLGDTGAFFLKKTMIDIVSISLTPINIFSEHLRPHALFTYGLICESSNFLVCHQILSSAFQLVRNRSKTETRDEKQHISCKTSAVLIWKFIKRDIKLMFLSHV